IRPSHAWLKSSAASIASPAATAGSKSAAGSGTRRRRRPTFRPSATGSRCATASSTRGESGRQVIAANIDTVFIVASLMHERNARRVERYVTMVWDSGATPVVLLNKADLVADPGAAADEIRQRLSFVDVHAISALEEGAPALSALQQYLAAGRTVALVGPSGVGKSTIVNRLLGRDAQKTGDVRESDSK